MVKLDNEKFFAKIFDKYNLTTIDVDANFARGFEFEPQASFNELMNFLQDRRPNRFRKKRNSAEEKQNGSSKL